MRLDYKNITIEPYGLLTGNELAPQHSSRYYGDGWGHSSGGSGAGHGGHGGQSTSQNRVGVSYGKYRVPKTYGSEGGASVYPFSGGRGGGRMEIVAHDTLVVDGTLSSCGGNGVSFRSGGGSGGSALVYTSRLHGDGNLDVSGGNGNSPTSQHGGGGAAGRIAVYYRENHFLGQFFATGGNSNFEPGGPGTVYLESVPGNNATYGYDRIDDAAHANRLLQLENEVMNTTQWRENRLAAEWRGIFSMWLYCVYIVFLYHFF